MDPSTDPLPLRESLSYPTQRMSLAARACTRLTRGCRKLGGIEDLLGPLSAKPAWMRWATYDRIVTKLEPVAERVDRDAEHSFGSALDRFCRSAAGARRLRELQPVRSS